jgi:hypothetical protein
MKDVDRLDKLIGIVVICVIVIAALILGVRLWLKRDAGTAAKSGPPEPEKKVEAPVKAAPVIDFDKLGKDEQLDALMKERKENLGIKKGFDIIAKPEESLKIGELTVEMQEIIDKIRLKEGEIVEKDLGPPGKEKAPPTSEKASQLPVEPSRKAIEKETKKNEIYGIYPAEPSRKAIEKKTKKNEIYGIYVVRPGDNIWNIHFTILRDYFELRGIEISPMSDEPSSQGVSSGVGKLLKFSEKIVYIYNIRQHKIDVDLDLIHPLSKIVVFKMNQVFTLLDQIDYNNINRIKFDGDTLWLPPQSGE